MLIGLKKDGQFRLVYERGRRITGEKVSICYLERDEEGIVPGFVASGRRVGKAYLRNRAKRLMREVFRKLEGRFETKGLWIVFIAAFCPVNTTLRELTEDVESSLVKVGLISKFG